MFVACFNTVYFGDMNSKNFLNQKLPNSTEGFTSKTIIIRKYSNYNFHIVNYLLRRHYSSIMQWRCDGSSSIRM